MVNSEELIKNIATLQADVAYLKSQDEELKRMIEDIGRKLDNLKMWLMGAMAAAIVSLLAHALR